ncbi:MAG TPA: di-trans,poly-cis-decaprenylcistransferase [Thermoanaerobaculia bacterium]|jgi:undecaprenyl diphosphate synthase|nr:di-trans,poly-cis-decaprenylcistransferase [Thermoanaerobaculia bacterium]
MNATLRLAPEPSLLGEGLHVAIIMDGNGRWATSRGWPRTAGHAEGVEAVRRVVEAAGDLGIRTLTLFAFSSDNWRRPDVEVRALMRLFRSYLMAEAAKCADNGIRISVIGRRDRLSPGLVRVIEDAEARTALGDRFLLRIAVDYSARDAILRAASRLSGQGSLSRETFARLLADPPHDGRPAPDVDLLIRTGGEKRLSDFLLWECAYAELVFTDRMWPDFGGADLAEAVREFNRRERRFGTVPVEVADRGGDEPHPREAIRA